MDSREVVIYDICGKEDLYQLEEHGCQDSQRPGSLDDFAEDNPVIPAYYLQIEELLLKRWGYSFTPRKLRSL